MRITKRTNPLNETTENAHEVVTEKVQKQFNGKRLTDNQLLLEHIIDLERKMVEMKFKHKKLKKRYNKLEQDIFDESDEEVEQSPEVEVSYDEPEHITAAPEQISRKPRMKSSWRNYITSM
jgi:seryl-tRNA synthetase